jgi:hypothetical protein
VKPRNADPVADLEALGAGAVRFNRSYHLMAGDDRQGRHDQFAFDLVQVGPAYATHAYTYEDLVRPGTRPGYVFEHERPVFDAARFV